ncbi:sirohydrochlorin chelatase [Leptolyngbya iicbica]|nr:sirohydrochlorin chelatase [Leptolyngbya sp. LK]
MRTAYLLVSHGSSDPRHQAGLTRLAQGVRQQLSRGHQSTQITIRPESAPWRSRPPAADLDTESPIVGTATLEAAEQSLAEQIVQFSRSLSQLDIQQLVIVPLFLLAGIHVKEDLPAEIGCAQQQLRSGVSIKCLPYLGSRPQFKQHIATRIAKTKADRCLLLAHGSRRPAGNRAIQQLGRGLDTDIAFWTVPPDLETQVYHLMQRGHQHIAIAPFFLFPGSITDAITHRTEQIAEHLPKLSLRLLSPLGTNSELGAVIADIIQSAWPSVTAMNGGAEVLSIADNSVTA